MAASLALADSAASSAETASWSGFELDGQVFALPGQCVERVVPATAVTRLPFAPAGVEGVASISGEVMPVVSLGALLAPDHAAPATTPPLFLAVRIADRRFALRVDRVLFMADALPDTEPAPASAPAAAVAIADWRGLPLTCLAAERLGVEHLEPFAPPRGAPGPIADRNAATEVALSLNETVLAVHAGGTAYALRAASVLELIEAVALTPLPLAPPVVLGVTVLRGEPLLTFSLARLAGHDSPAAPAAFIAARSGASRFVLAVDAIDGLRHVPANGAPADGAPVILDLAALLASKWLSLTASSVGHVGAPPVADRRRQRYLCVSLGDQPCAIPLSAIERILSPRPPVRLPAGAPPGVDGAVDFGGRVIPVTDGWRWLSRPEGGPIAAHIVLRHEGEHRVLTVNAVQRMVTMAEDDILTTSGHDPRIAGLGRAHGRSLAILAPAALVGGGRAP
jgi:purine-binding chemotaxis protein CheW